MRVTPVQDAPPVPHTNLPTTGPCRECGGARYLLSPSFGFLLPCSCQTDEERWKSARIPSRCWPAEPSSLPSEEIPVSRYFAGPVGRGKTWKAVGVLKRFVRKTYGGVFVDLAELEDARRSALSRKEDLPGEALFTTPFILADDLCRRPRVTDWWEEYLSELIRRRYNAELPTVWTSNLELPEIAKLIGEHLASRIAEACKGRIHVLKGRDRRVG